MSNNSFEMGKKYTYNASSGKITFLSEEKFGKNLVYDRNTIKKILELYSDFDGVPHTATEISQKTGVPKDRVLFVVKMLGKTHSCLPIFPEEIDDQPVDQIVDELVELKEHSVRSKFEKVSLQKTKEDATNWLELKAGKLSLVKDFLEKVRVNTPVLTKPIFTPMKTGDVYLASVSDIHFGIQHYVENAFNGKPYNFEDIKEIIENYIHDIIRDVNNRKTGFEKCVLVNAGDTLHSLSGFTSKGTKLQDGVWGHKQFVLAFETLAFLIQSLHNIFGTVEVKSVGGNHAFVEDYILFYSLEKYFDRNMKILFDISTARWMDFVIKNTLFVLDHGSSATIKSVLPEGSKQREAFIQNIFMNVNTSKYDTIDHRVYICGDKHNIQYGEYANFEFVRFSTPVKGESYSDQLGLKNRPRFNALVINDDGIKEILNYYVK